VAKVNCVGGRVINSVLLFCKKMMPTYEFRDHIIMVIQSKLIRFMLIKRR
jgi:hypothetical protein